MRTAFVERVRDKLLEPRLRSVARQGAVSPEALAMQTRRSVYYLALLHSDRTDPLRLLEGNHLDVVSSMTELPEGFVRDYIEAVDARREEPVAFELMPSDVEPNENWLAWTRFLNDFEETLSKPENVTFAHLRGLRARAVKLEAALKRSEHDRLTVELLGAAPHELAGHVTRPVDAADAAAGAVGAVGTGGAAGLAGTNAANGKSGPRKAAAAPRGQSLLQLEPSYAPKYAEYLRYAREYRIAEQAHALGDVIAVVLARRDVDAPKPSSLEALVEALEDLVGADGPPGSLATLKVAGLDYILDIDRWRAALRSVDMRDQLDDFLDNAGAAIFFNGEPTAGARPVRSRPAEGAPIAKARPALTPRYTKQAYDEHVRRPVLRLVEVLGKSGLSDEQQKPLLSFVREAVREYALSYAAQSRALVHGYRADARSVEELRVVIAQMVDPEGSAFDDLLKSVDENTRLACESIMLEPACETLAEFDGWHAVVGAQGGAPAIVQYRATLSQLLSDLGPAEGAAAATPPPGPETLERTLGPAGKLTLAEIKGDKGAYARLVSDWATTVGLPDDQRRVFTAPVTALGRLGGEEIGRALDHAWQTEMLPDLRRVAERFPFRPDAKEDVPAADVEAIFHPQKGRFFDAFRRHFEPVFDFGDGGPFAPKPAASARVKLPAHIADVVNAAASLSARLFDEKGVATSMAVRVATVPFERGADPKLAPTLAHLSAGASSLVNFNQKPVRATLRLDWALEYESQAGLQLTDIASGERSFADPFVAEKSPWSFLRLLQQAKSSPSKLEPEAREYAFRFKIGDAGTELPVRFVVLDDPSRAFSLGALVRSKLSAPPKRAGR
ncbi:MAG: hypothetical protein MUF34_11975 [Polyangiaceae bacterium]|nr:hypothetical protein [Polyangiaceae bacterium]